MPPGTQMCRVTLQEEFEKNPELNKEDLDRMREWTLSQKHLPMVPDEMLVMFLHSCYYNLDRAQDCVEKYYSVRSSAPNLFNSRDARDPEFRKHIKAINVTMLPIQDSKGYHYFYHGLRDSDPSNYNHVCDNKLIYMTMDAWVARQGTTLGLVLLMDMKGAKLGHLTKVNLSVVRLASKYVQEGSPLRLKAIHVLNTLSWVDKLLAVIRPFTSKEIMDLIHFHKEDSPTLYECVPRECLPCDFGGTLPSVEKLSDENLRMLEGLTDFFLEDEKMRVDETKRDKTKKKNKTAVEEIASVQFKKLEID